MKRNKIRNLLAVTAASAVLLMTGCDLADDQDFNTNSDGSVTSGSLTVSGELNNDVGAKGANATLTLSLSNTTFALDAATGDNLSGYINFTALDSSGSTIETITNTKVVAASAISAGATSIPVTATFSDNGTSTIENGSFKASVSSGALSGSAKTTGTGGSINLAASTLTAGTVTDGVFTEAGDGLWTVSGGSSVGTGYVLITFKGKAEGFTYSPTNASGDTLDVTVTSLDTSDTAPLGTVTATATAYTGGILVKVEGAGTAVLATQTGTFSFNVPYANIKKGDTDFATYWDIDTTSVDYKTFTSADALWKINGISLSLSGDGIDTAAEGYGTVDATVTTDAILVTATAADGSTVTVNSLSAVDSDDDSITFTGTSTGTANTFKLSYTNSLASSADNKAGSLVLTANLTVGGNSLSVTASETAAYSLSYKSYLETPTAAQVLAATNSDTTAEVYTTVINLAAYGKALSAAPAEGTAVASGTVGSTNVTAEALSGATASYIPVKISGTDLSGAVTLTMSGDDSIVVKQTDTLHLAKLTAVQNFETATDIATYSITVQDATKAASEIATNTTTLINSGNPIPEAYGNVWRQYNVSNDKGVRGAYMPLTGVPSSGIYVIEFDARLAPSNLTNGDNFMITNAVRSNGNDVKNTIFALDCVTANTGSQTQQAIDWRLWSNNTDTGITVPLREDLFYHYTLKIDVDNAKVTIAIACTDDTSVEAPLEETEIAIHGSSYVATGVWLGTCKQLLAEQMIDNIVVYTAN